MNIWRCPGLNLLKYWRSRKTRREESHIPDLADGEIISRIVQLQLVALSWQASGVASPHSRECCSAGIKRIVDVNLFIVRGARWRYPANPVPRSLPRPYGGRIVHTNGAITLDVSFLLPRTSAIPGHCRLRIQRQLPETGSPRSSFCLWLVRRAGFARPSFQAHPRSSGMRIPIFAQQISSIRQNAAINV